MEVYMEISLLISGAIAGMIVFQTTIIAPSVFKALNADQAGVFLRSVFPKLFLMICVLGVISFVQAFLFYNPSLVQKFVAGITIMGMSICYLIVPATNRARDTKNNSLFKRLHAISVLLTMIVLIANLSWVIWS